MAGGHSAWKKRVARGELAKGAGGAIARHRPHLGRTGKDLILNRKGHIAGGNPKKLKKQQRRALLLRLEQEQKRISNGGGKVKKLSENPTADGPEQPNGKMVVEKAGRSQSDARQGQKMDMEE
mmetsp:Transcript_14256/g.18612  ORF Transcript_14256/g.18612 Transcript_14256/m.18612 type:complete len:123 (-) Transcript_14256:272-640(-)